MENDQLETKQETKNTGNEIKLTSQFLNIGLGVVALILWIIIKVCVGFGVVANGLYGVLSLMVYACSFCGTVWAYVRNKKLTLELVLNAGILLLALCFLV